MSERRGRWCRLGLRKQKRACQRLGGEKAGRRGWLTHIGKRDGLDAWRQLALLAERKPCVLVVDPDLERLSAVWGVAHEEEV